MINSTSITMFYSSVIADLLSFSGYNRTYKDFDSTDTLSYNKDKFNSFLSKVKELIDKKFSSPQYKNILCRTYESSRDFINTMLNLIKEARSFADNEETEKEKNSLKAINNIMKFLNDYNDYIKDLNNESKNLLLSNIETWDEKDFDDFCIYIFDNIRRGVYEKYIKKVTNNVSGNAEIKYILDISDLKSSMFTIKYFNTIDNYIEGTLFYRSFRITDIDKQIERIKTKKESVKENEPAKEKELVTIVYNMISDFMTDNPILHLDNDIKKWSDETFEQFGKFVIVNATSRYADKIIIRTVSVHKDIRTEYFLKGTEDMDRNQLLYIEKIYYVNDGSLHYNYYILGRFLQR